MLPWSLEPQPSYASDHHRTICSTWARECLSIPVPLTAPWRWSRPSLQDRNLGSQTWMNIDAPWLYMGMDQYLLIPFLGEWTSIYQLFWCSPGVQGFDPSPYNCSQQFYSNSFGDPKCIGPWWPMFNIGLRFSAARCLHTFDHRSRPGHRMSGNSMKFL